MRATTVFGLAVTLVCSVYCAEPPVTVQKIYLEKKTKNDLESQATGYIFRSDGDNPPIYIKLGTGNIHQYDDVLKRAGITSSLESDRPDFGDLNQPSKSSYTSVHSDYKDVTPPKKMTYSSVKSEYTDINYPPKNNRQPVRSHYSTHEESAERPRDSPPGSIPSYDEPGFPSPESEIFKEAFKLIHQGGNAASGERSDFPLPLPVDRREGPKSRPSIPSADDGYGNAQFEPGNGPSLNPGAVSHHGNGENYEVRVHEKNQNLQQSKAYIAPIFDAPQQGEVFFNPRQAPVKYSLQPALPLAQYGQRVTHDYPVDGAEYSGESGGKDHQEYSAHYKADYHHKPKKTKYEKGGGEAFKEHHFSKHGEKGDKGYKKYHDFDEGEMGHHGKEGKKGYHDNESGHKKEHHHDGKKYGEVHGKLHGEKGVKYGEMEGHKKGHKTSGYHNIFHKDEFKKEHKFYDDEHKHGYKDKHGGYHTDHGKKHAHKSSGDFHDAAFDQGHKGDAGTYKKGHFDQDHKGHKGSSGHESHYNHHEDYGKKGGESDKKKYGYHHGH